MPTSVSPVPLVFVVIFHDKLQVPAPTVRRIWQAMQADKSPETQALRYHIGRVDARLWRDEDLRGPVAVLMEGPASPRRLLPLLEGYVEQGKLKRNDVNELEEAILKDTGRTGQWR